MCMGILVCVFSDSCAWSKGEMCQTVFFLLSPRVLYFLFIESLHCMHEHWSILSICGSCLVLGFVPDLPKGEIETS